MIPVGVNVSVRESNSGIPDQAIAPAYEEETHGISDGPFRRKRFFQIENNQISFIDLLTAEHKALRRALKILRTMTDRVERGISTDDMT